MAPFSIDINTLLANFQVEYIELQLKVGSSLYQTSISLILPERNILRLTCVTASGSTYVCEQLFFKAEAQEE